ncbi:MAG: exo-alpha-sialidase [Acidobacteria bacterium]|nr:exo-alpha-sialidase [Acidobacteriota bacterium]MBI3656754.1 exo-alpha-sialidase [Acidobacteriota bacterium]
MILGQHLRKLNRRFIFGAILFLLGSLSVFADFTTPRELARPVDGAGGPSIATFEQNIYVTWSGNGNIYLITSTDGGENFSLPRIIFSAGGLFGLAAADDGTVYAAFARVEGSYGQIIVARSTNRGETFTQRVVSDRWSISGDCSPFRPLKLDAGFGRVYVLWKGRQWPAGLGCDTYIATSQDQGTTWSAPREIPSPHETCYEICRDRTPFRVEDFFVDGHSKKHTLMLGPYNREYPARCQPIVPFYLSPFGAIPLIAGRDASPSVLSAKLAASYNAIHVLYRQYDSLRYTRSVDEGISFSSGTIIYDGNPSGFLVATDYWGTLAIGWVTSNGFFLRLSYDDGQTCTSPQNLTRSGDIALAFDPLGVLHIVWSEGSPGRIVYVRSIPE